jgi:hypothetical protein
MWFWLGVVVSVVLIGTVAWLIRHPVRFFGREMRIERARELFRLQRERLQTLFLRTAAASGKPRGLRWKACHWDPGVEFVRERRTGHIAALVGVTIEFEAIEGGDMEGVPAVADQKNASAVFFFHRGHWGTVGKAVFNKNPDEAIQHFDKQYERIPQVGEGHAAS